KASLLGGVSVLALAMSLTAAPDQAVAQSTDTCLTDVTFDKTSVIGSLNPTTTEVLTGITSNSGTAVTGPIINIPIINVGGLAGITVLGATFTPVTSGSFVTSVGPSGTADAITDLGAS